MNKQVKFYVTSRDDEVLMHYGVINQKWGVITWIERRKEERAKIKAENASKRLREAEIRYKANPTSANKASLMNAKTSYGKAKEAHAILESERKAREADEYKTEAEKTKKIADGKRKESLEKARAAKEQKRVYEEGKQKALKKGTAEDILQYKGDLTNDEMNNAITRLKLEKDLSAYLKKPIEQVDQKKVEAVKPQVQSKFDQAVELAKKAGTLANTAESLLGTYNKAAKIYNTFNKDAPMKVFESAEETAKKAKAAAEEAEKKAEKERAKSISDIINTRDPKKIFDNWDKMTLQEQKNAKESLNYFKEINKIIKDPEYISRTKDDEKK